ncbi:MAG: ATP-binding protein [Planctomycetota bacterium]
MIATALETIAPTSINGVSQATMMLDLLPIGALIVDRHLVVQRWNDKLAEWSGLPADEIVGMSLADLIPDAKYESDRSRIRQVIETGLPATFSPVFHKHLLPFPARHGLDCDEMIQQTEVRRIPGDEGWAIITIQDVSYQYVQLERLREKSGKLIAANAEIARHVELLTAKNQELDDFAHVASHDLQEPLRAISILVDFLQEDLDTETISEDCERYLKQLAEASTRMRSLVRDVLALSRLGGVDRDHTSVDLNDVVRQVQTDLDLRIAESRAIFQVDPLPVIQGDRRLLSQLFFNLISNSLKFVVDRPPKIRIAALEDDSEYTIAVEDNGIGIDPRYISKIFKPFQRLHRRQDFSGNGIGLAVCEQAVTRHGGRIWVHPDAAQGAEIRFTLPKSAEAAAERTPAVAARGRRGMACAY